MEEQSVDGYAMAKHICNTLNVILISFQDLTRNNEIAVLMFVETKQNSLELWYYSEGQDSQDYDGISWRMISVASRKYHYCLKEKDIGAILMAQKNIEFRNIRHSRSKDWKMINCRN